MCGNTRPALTPIVAAFAVQTLIQHLDLTRQLKAELQDLKRPPSPEPERGAA